jgi:glycosyltransferase involved in cell wall biosynthesis
MRQHNNRVVIFLRNIEGGVASVVRAFLNYRTENQARYKLVILTDDESKVNRITLPFSADEIVYFNYSRFENVYHMLKKLRNFVTSPNDIVWANERTEIAMINLFKLPNPLIYMIHGNSEYYYRTVEDYCSVVDCFIGVSEWIKNRAHEIVSSAHCTSQVVKVFAPVPLIPYKMLDNESNSIGLIYTGRLEEEKGSHLIPAICDGLDLHNIQYEFTIIGTGILEVELKNKLRFNNSVKFLGHLDQPALFKELEKNQIFLFPSYSEAIGLSVVEAMKVGLVPIVSDLESGLPEIVSDEDTGFRVSVGDVEGFVKEIVYLKNQPQILQHLSRNASAKANLLFDPQRQSKLIEDILKRTGQNNRNKEFKNIKLGFRLDSKYLPSFFVITLRFIRDRLNRI